MPKHLRPCGIKRCFVNLSNGEAVDLDALYHNLKSGKISGAAIDVFPNEPVSNDETFLSNLAALDNVILTPHIGGQTVEARENTANFVPNQIIDYINTGSTFGSANFSGFAIAYL